MTATLTAGNCKNLTAPECDELVIFIRELNDDIQIAEIIGNLAIAQSLRQSRRKARADLRNAQQ